MSKVVDYQQEIMDAITELDDMTPIVGSVGRNVAAITHYSTDDQYLSANTVDLAITALRAQIDPDGCWYCTGIESHSIATVKTVTDEYGHELGAYDTPYNYCPNCGRRIALIPSESTQSGAIRQARGDEE